MNLFLENFPNLFIKQFNRDFLEIIKLHKRFRFYDSFNRAIPRLRNTKEIKEALNYNKKLNFDKKLYLNKLNEYKELLLKSLYLNKIDKENINKKELSEYNITSAYLYLNNNNHNIGGNYKFDFENKEIFFENTKIKLDTKNKSYKLFKNVFDKIEYLKDEINRL